MVAGASVVMVMVVPLSVGVFTLQPTTDTSPEMHLAQEWHEAGLHSWKPASDALMLVGDTGFEPVRPAPCVTGYDLRKVPLTCLYEGQ
jgi:hypothetical protein